jgi:glycosyltransferase involved in cell wall biosynthesis
MGFVPTERMLNLFYAEPECDRWLPLDRYPRRIIRRFVRGPRQPGGMERYFLNLVEGLRRAGIPHRQNPFAHARRQFKEVVGIIGKSHLLRTRPWRNPIVFGPAVFSHPLSDLAVFRERPIKKVLVSCEWLKRMYAQTIDVPVEVWPAGVDTYTWRPRPEAPKDIDVLVYDKVRWRREKYEPELIQPILANLTRRGLRHQTIRYGSYREEEFHALLARCRSMIFLVEHETQGFAYLQALACDVPILGWDRGGFWEDPEFYPHRVRFEGVSSLPYWDDRCGVKFAAIEEFTTSLDRFVDGLARGAFRPRDYVTQNLSLEDCARAYVRQIETLTPPC